MGGGKVAARPEPSLHTPVLLDLVGVQRHPSARLVVPSHEKKHNPGRAVAAALACASTRALLATTTQQVSSCLLFTTLRVIAPRPLRQCRQCRRHLSWEVGSPCRTWCCT